MSWLLALPLSMIVALAGRWAGALTSGGAAAAIIVGGGILAGAGWTGAAALVVFFVGSSAISGWLESPEPTVDGKGTRRDATQVLANGGAAAAGALVGALIDPDLARWVATASLAAAGADTWATAVGARSSVPPRLLLRRSVVLPGTSGGVTFVGSVGAVAGAVLVASAGALAASEPALGLAAATVGLAGSFLDSALGDALQGRFHCPACDAATERTPHRCGRVAHHTGGLSWVTNDGVNGLTTIAAAFAGWGVWAWWRSL